MPFYHKLGKPPHKRHTQFRNPYRELCREEPKGLKGFKARLWLNITTSTKLQTTLTKAGLNQEIAQILNSQKSTKPEFFHSAYPAAPANNLSATEEVITIILRNYPNKQVSVVVYNR